MVLKQLIAVGVLIVGFFVGAALYEYFNEENTEAPHQNRNDSKRRRNGLRPKPNQFLSDICVICIVNEPNIKVIPCGHICMCRSCHQRHAESFSICPVCRSSVSKYQITA